MIIFHLFIDVKYSLITLVLQHLKYLIKYFLYIASILQYFSLTVFFTVLNILLYFNFIIAQIWPFCHSSTWLHLKYFTWLYILSECFGFTTSEILDQIYLIYRKHFTIFPFSLTVFFCFFYPVLNILLYFTFIISQILPYFSITTSEIFDYILALLNEKYCQNVLVLQHPRYFMKYTLIYLKYFTIFQLI